MDMCVCACLCVEVGERERESESEREIERDGVFESKKKDVSHRRETASQATRNTKNITSPERNKDKRKVNTAHC